MRVLGRANAIILLVAIGGCTKSLSCHPPREEAFKCINDWREASDRTMLLKCYPFSAPERIKGVWVFGFETNGFAEGATTNQQVASLETADTQLVIDPEPDGQIPFPRTFTIEFVGRRSLCDMGFPRHYIIVDRVISQRELR